MRGESDSYKYQHKRNVRKNAFKDMKFVFQSKKLHFFNNFMKYIIWQGM